MSDGSNIGGSVSAGRDVTGRDNINIKVGDDDPRPQRSDSERLRRIENALLGDPYRPHDAGLLKAFGELRDTISSLIARMGEMELRQAEMQKRQEHFERRQAGTDWRLYAISAAGFVTWLLFVLWSILGG